MQAISVSVIDNERALVRECEMRELLRQVRLCSVLPYFLVAAAIYLEAQRRKLAQRILKTIRTETVYVTRMSDSMITR